MSYAAFCGERSATAAPSWMHLRGSSASWCHPQWTPGGQQVPNTSLESEVPKVVESLSPGFPDLTKAAGERVQGILQDEEVTKAKSEGTWRHCKESGKHYAKRYLVEFF